MIRGTERGFVLISAMWLLMLAGSIAALLMLHALASARDFKEAAQVAKTGSEPEPVFATVIAGLLLGRGSSWAELPASGSLMVEGIPVQASLELETTKLDVNKAPLAAIDGRLHDAGYSSDRRVVLLNRIALVRSEHRLLNSFAAVEALGADVLPNATEPCLDAQLSPFGGLDGAPPLIGQARSAHLGDVLRLTLRGARQRSRIFVVRVTGTPDDPYGVLDWYDDTCPATATA